MLDRSAFVAWLARDDQVLSCADDTTFDELADTAGGAIVQLVDAACSAARAVTQPEGFEFPVEVVVYDLSDEDEASIMVAVRPRYVGEAEIPDALGAVQIASFIEAARSFGPFEDHERVLGLAGMAETVADVLDCANGLLPALRVLAGA